MTNKQVADLYAQLLKAYPSFEHAALDGARWQVGANEYRELRTIAGLDNGEPHPDDRLLALPVEVIDSDQQPTLMPGRNARKAAP